jgi:hypothetical protein
MGNPLDGTGDAGCMALVEHDPARTIFTRFIPPQNKLSARGAWKAY